MTTTNPTDLIVVRILLALIILGIAFAVVGCLLYLDSRQKRREAQAKAAVRELQTNPDAFWLYSQGLSPDEIELAVQARGGLR